MNKNKRIETIFIWVIATMSILGILDLTIFDYEINFFSRVFSVSSSLIGLLGVLLYYQRKRIFQYFILFWILFQFIEISEYLIDTQGIKYWRMIFISKQFFDLTIKQTFDFHGAGYKVEFNFLPILYLYFFQTLRLNSLRGHRFEIIRFREKSDLDINSFKGEIIDRVTINKEKKSFLILLDSPIQINESGNLEYCLVSDSKSKRFGIDIDLNLTLYGLKKESVLEKSEINSSKIEYIDWIEGKITNPNNSA